MHLVYPLISGIANAGDGTARITRRGTMTPATLYSSFEGDPFGSSDLDSSDRVILDSYGRKEVYVDEVCDVSVYNQDGELQIQFTAGSAISAIEVRSPSFMGNDYTTGASGPGLPTTLQHVLDLWSQAQGTGAADWEIPALDPPLFVVTDPKYGAKGDGFTDDTDAIKGAVAAAEIAGGTVYLPAGTYRTTDEINAGFVTVQGAGRTLTQIKAERDGTAGLHGDNSRFADLTVWAIGTGEAITGSDLVIERCNVKGKGPLIASLGGTCRCMDTDFDAGGGDTTTLVTTGTIPGAVLFADRCSFSLNSTAPGAVVGIAAQQLYLDTCVFAASLVVGATITYVKCPTPPIVGRVIGCAFGAPVPGTVTAALDLGGLTNAQFYEDDNSFGANVKAYSYTAAPPSDVQLCSRDKRVLTISDNGATVALPTDQYGVIVLKSTAAAIAMTGTLPPQGARGTILLYRISGAGGTAQPTTNFFGSPATVATVATQSNVWEYVTAVGNTALRMFVTVDGRSMGAVATP